MCKYQSCFDQVLSATPKSRGGMLLLIGKADRPQKAGAFSSTVVLFFPWRWGHDEGLCPGGLALASTPPTCGWAAPGGEQADLPARSRVRSPPSGPLQGRGRVPEKAKKLSFNGQRTHFLKMLPS